MDKHHLIMLRRWGQPIPHSHSDGSSNWGFSLLQLWHVAGNRNQPPLATKPQPPWFTGHNITTNKMLALRRKKIKIVLSVSVALQLSPTMTVSRNKPSKSLLDSKCCKHILSRSFQSIHRKDPALLQSFSIPAISSESTFLWKRERKETKTWRWHLAKHCCIRL